MEYPLSKDSIAYIVYVRVSYLDPGDGCFAACERFFSTLRAAMRYFVLLQQQECGEDLNVWIPNTVVLLPIMLGRY